MIESEGYQTVPEDSVNGNLIEEAEQSAEDGEAENSLAEAISENESEELPDWESRCLAAEAALADSLEFAELYAAEGGELSAPSLRESEVYRRFCELRSLGLSVKEAFFAADSAREKKPSLADKHHLLSSPAKRQPKYPRLSGEELMLARQILGDEYSNEDLMKLYRRVAKS